jgi:uncharacterized membrane protein YeaQ/YmgE (transglycosylase-associated protein family)
MSIISWIILGLIAGFIGSKIVNKQGQGMLLDIALGVVGQSSVASSSVFLVPLELPASISGA